MGRRTKVLGTEQLPAACPACGQNKRYLSVFQSYLHIMWIPTIPLPKKLFLQCLGCKKIQHDKDLNSVEREQFRGKKGNYRTPIWLFSGLLLIAGLAGWMFYQDKQHKDETVAFLAAPRAGDLYVVQLKKKDEKLPYRVLKLLQIEGDVYTFDESNYGYHFSSDVDSNLSHDLRDKADFFSGTPEKLPKSAVAEFTVVRVIRH